MHQEAPNAANGNEPQTSNMPENEASDIGEFGELPFNASIKIGDISIPELRRRLFKRRQEILKKNKYYVQQKVNN